MNEAEFLKSWPSLGPAVWHLISAAVAQAERERDEAMRGRQEAEEGYEISLVIVSSLRAELAATQAIVRRVEQERDEAKRERDPSWEYVEKLKAERDALQKQNDQLKRQLSQAIT